MNNLNSLLIEGNVVRDSTYRETPSGTPVTTFSVAVNRYWKKDKSSADFEKEVSYFDVEVWGKLAESARDSCRKGRGVRVVGRLKQERWDDAEGKQRSKVKIIGEHIEYKPIDYKKDDAITAPPEQQESGGDNGVADDIPF